MYASIQDFEERFGSISAIELTNFEHPTATTVTQPRLVAAIGDASSFIDLHLAKAGLKTPIGDVTAHPKVGTVPATITRLACELAYYYLDQYSNEGKERYDRVLEFLTAIAEGKVDLGLPDLKPAPTASPVGWYSGERVFDQAKLRALGYDIPRY